MNPLRQNLASLLRDSAQRGIDELDPESPCAKAFKKMNVDAVLDEDIGRICENVTYSELTRVISLAAGIKIAPRHIRRLMRAEMKKIAEGVAKRTEEKSGKLQR